MENAARDETIRQLAQEKINKELDLVKHLKSLQVLLLLLIEEEEGVAIVSQDVLMYFVMVMIDMLMCLVIVMMLLSMWSGQGGRLYDP